VNEQPSDEPGSVRGFASLLGIENIEVAEDHSSVTARAEVTDRLLQPFGVVHGGVYAGIAESICSWATLHAVREQDMVAMGQASTANFLRPISAGYVNVVATRRHGGRTTWVWDVECSDDEGRTCALVRMTIAVRAAR
jgi:1,4-dihydroxy-2-naphthoyl-CoA hydrolase